MSSRGDDQDLARTHRRTVLLGLMFAATGALAAAATPRRREDVLGRARLETVVPNQVGAWRYTPEGALVLPESQVPDSIYDQVLARSYVGDGQPLMMLLIAYGAAQSGLMQVHRPDTCYGSSGFKVTDSRPVAVDVGAAGAVPARTFWAEREDHSEQVLYWTRIAGAFPRSPAAQRLVMLEAGVRGFIPDGVLVRISTPGANTVAGLQAMNRFARALVSEAAPLERSLLVGGLSGNGANRTGAA